MEEKQLLNNAVNGDMSAFEQLALMNEAMSYSLALRLVGNAEDARDAVQGAFIKAYRAIGAFRGECSFSSWLYRITYNICIDMIRRKKAATSLDALNEMGLAIADSGLSPEEEAERHEQGRAIAECIKMLDPKSREIIILRDIEGLSYEEIAAALQINIGTVKSRINRSRLKLKALLLEKGVV
ncbi:MAG: RNA polymerase sigma factor [Christensenellales bacterium]|jgi:RNA polymerase sigma-70 factor (ECF subfamily)